MLHGAAIALLELVGFAGGIQSLSILNAVAVAVALRFVGRWYGTGLTFGPRLPNALPPAREINRLRPASPPPSRR